MDSQKEVEDDAAELKATLDRIKQDQASHKAQQVELKGVKVPEGMKSKGPTISLSTMPRLYERPSYPPPSEKPRKRDPDAKVFVSNKGKLDRFRKEAKAMGHFQKPARRSGIWAPKDMQLRPATPKMTAVTAPHILIEEHRKAAVPTVLDPSVKPAVIFTPKKKRERHDEIGQAGVLTIEEREKRLKAFTNPSNASKATSHLEALTSPDANSATSLHERAKASSPSTSATSLTSNVQPTPSLSSPLKRKDSASPTLGYDVPRINTSSPSNGGIRPAMNMKKKAPVDVFMPAKRRKIA